VPWGRLSPWKWVPGISAGVKAAGAYGWRPTTLVVPKVENIRGLNLLGTPRATSACCGMTFTFTLLSYPNMISTHQMSFVSLGYNAAVNLKYWIFQTFCETYWSGYWPTVVPQSNKTTPHIKMWTEVRVPSWIIWQSFPVLEGRKDNGDFLIWNFPP